MNFRNQFEKKENDGVKAVLAKIIKQFDVDVTDEDVNDSLSWRNDESLVRDPKITPPVDKNCGKLTVATVKDIASRCSIPFSMVSKADTEELDSFSYVANFWLYSPEVLWNMLMIHNATPVSPFKDEEYFNKSFALQNLPVVTNKLTYKPRLLPEGQYNDFTE